MRRPRRNKIIADINIAPFTDVVLVLLIIFMVATPLIFRSSIKIALPQVSNNTQNIDNKDINVFVTSSGEVTLDGQRYNIKLDSGVFKFKLQQLIKSSPDIAIIINGDRAVKYDYIVAVVDIASKVGIKHLVLATEFKR